MGFSSQHKVLSQQTLKDTPHIFRGRAKNCPAPRFDSKTTRDHSGHLPWGKDGPCKASAAEQSPRPRSTVPRVDTTRPSGGPDRSVPTARRISETERATDKRQRHGHSRAASTQVRARRHPCRWTRVCPQKRGRRARRSGRGGRRHGAAVPVPPSPGSGDGPASPASPTTTEKRPLRLPTTYPRPVRCEGPELLSRTRRQNRSPRNPEKGAGRAGTGFTRAAF